MDNKKFVTILLLITIILSICSVVVTLNLKLSNPSVGKNLEKSKEVGNVQLIIEETNINSQGDKVK
jgi:hypothetical protein